MLTIGMKVLVEQIAEGILCGLKRDGWLPADLAACKRPTETVDEMRARFALERARNIVSGIQAEVDLAAELAEAA